MGAPLKIVWDDAATSPFAIASVTYRTAWRQLASPSVIHAQSVVVPLGAAHRISNLHDEPLLIIEVQHGDYLGEDDICRLEDDYGRNAQVTG
ncbi:MAG: hypothetical protein U0R80_02505 [Nocardioidaceae bacterium]